MVLGDLDAWARRFITVDERIIERIAVLWSQCVALLLPQPEEDAVTINLVQLLVNDPVIRQICHNVEYQFEPFGMHPNGTRFSKGKIDIAVLLDWERERYVAYECKRLNVMRGGRRNSLANLYVKQGMMRFITEQYAEALPVGCMIGYVIDGDISFALTQLARIIGAHQPLGLVNGPTTAASVQNIARFLTMHKRATGPMIALRHALLPFA